MNRIHCSFHKCLTNYFSKVMRALYNYLFFFSGGYRHFKSEVGNFHTHFRDLRVASVNNQFLDLNSLGDFRLSRFVRDPRDLVVSGYFYHRKGVEEWTKIVDPTPDQWRSVNGVVPAEMPSGSSFSTYLQALNQEEGLKAEIEFRQRHFAAMEQWSEVDSEQICVYRYEELLGKEEETFRSILNFYEFSGLESFLGGKIAYFFSAGRYTGSDHIRDPQPAQWKKHFSPAVEEYFVERHPSLIEAVGYEPF